MLPKDITIYILELNNLVKKCDDKIYLLKQRRIQQNKNKEDLYQQIKAQSLIRLIQENYFRKIESLSDIEEQKSIRKRKVKRYVALYSYIAFFIMAILIPFIANPGHVITLANLLLPLIGIGFVDGIVLAIEYTCINREYRPYILETEDITNEFGDLEKIKELLKVACTDEFDKEKDDDLQNIIHGFETLRSEIEHFISCLESEKIQKSVHHEDLLQDEKIEQQMNQIRIRAKKAFGKDDKK